VGYQYTGDSGMTFTASVGVGYAIGSEHIENAAAVLTGIAVGYTWR
jgi:hypothetical protein